MVEFQKYKFDRPSFLNKPHYKSIGYIRENASSETIEIKANSLREEGCCKIFQEKISTRVKGNERPQLMAALKSLEACDELVISKIQLLGNSQVEIVSRIHLLQQKGIHIRSLDGLINTREFGKFSLALTGLLSGLAGVERSLTQERAKENLQKRRETGQSLGGRPKTSNVKAGLVLRLRNEGNSYRSIREQTGLALSTIRRIIMEQE